MMVGSMGTNALLVTYNFQSVDCVLHDGIRFTGEGIQLYLYRLVATYSNCYTLCNILMYITDF